ncbi:MAG: tRNA (adenosine(37)-N6)-dimethylallyltransferase MiaA [Candidatus Eremiobacteraeota bacterium]|nr:tRNA (adenosine(37)-N6)-dimethylallyltransferase MiaA [Candidatus Eremiobacteraeota bacterium]
MLVLAGATASGKTQLAIELARRFNAEIVGADSRQIYRGMPIGTAAPTAAQRTAVPHHLIDFLDPQQRYSAAQFSHDAIECISDIHARGKHAIVTGGTGFYIRALAGDVALAPPGDAGLRQRLSVEARLHEPDFLHQWLAVREPARAASIAPTDRYRVMRSLEVSLMQTPSSTALSRASLSDVGIPFAKIFIDVDDATLEKRIAARVDAMLADGLIEEAERIGPQAVAASAVGYLQALAYVRGWQTFDELRRGIIRATRRYAKRQRTWFRSEPQTIWVRSNNPLSDVEKLAREKLGWA